MSDFKLACSYLKSRLLVTLLIVLSVALGLGLATMVLTLSHQATDMLRRETARWDIIVGAKGSPLQLVLNGLYYLDAPTGNIDLELWEHLREDPAVALAVPLTMGDNYFGWPIVGTMPEFLTARESDDALLKSGRIFNQPFEIVAGAEVAARQQLRLGQQVVGAHGWGKSDDLHPDSPYTVVGILAPTGTSLDRALYTDYHSTWLVHTHGHEEEAAHESEEGVPADDEGAHEHEHEHAHHDGGQEITLLLVRLHQPGHRFRLTEALNAEGAAQAVIPVDEINRLEMMFIRPMQNVLLVVAYLVVIVSALSILISLYLSIHQRQRDIAVLRSLGATQGDVFRLITVEAALLSGLGVLFGWLLGRGILSLGSPWCQAQFGITLADWSMRPAELIIMGSVWALGILAGLLPAIVAYRLPVAEILTKE